MPEIPRSGGPALPWVQEGTRKTCFQGSLGQAARRMGDSIGARFLSPGAVNDDQKEEEEPRLLFMYLFIYLLHLLIKKVLGLQTSFSLAQLREGRRGVRAPMPGAASAPC